jgi:hypothetical protein
MTYVGRPRPRESLTVSSYSPPRGKDSAEWSSFDEAEAYRRNSSTSFPRRDQHPTCHVDEQTVLDHAGHIAEVARQRLRIGNLTEVAIEGCDSRCQTFNYLIPTVDSVIEVVANLSIIRGDDFHIRKNRPLPRMRLCCSCAFAVSSFWFYSPVL